MRELFCDQIFGRGYSHYSGSIHAWSLAHVKWGSSDALVSRNALSGNCSIVNTRTNVSHYQETR